MRFYNKKRIFFLAVFMLALLLTSCGSKETDANVTVKNFFQAAKSQDLKTMNSLVNKKEAREIFKYDDPDKEKLNEMIFSKINYQVLTTMGDEKTKVIRCSIASPDLVRIYSKAIKESSSNLDNKDKAIINRLINLVDDANSPKISTVIDIKVIKDKDSWVIEPSSELNNAITGNLEKAYKNADKLSSNGGKADSKIYGMGEEAISEKASISVTKVEESTQSGYVTLHEGNKFIIVYLKEKNISEKSIEYGGYQFKVQNSKGEIIRTSEAKLGKDFGQGNLAAGESVDGTITFEVSQNEEELTLIYSPASEALLKFKLK